MKMSMSESGSASTGFWWPCRKHVAVVFLPILAGLVKFFVLPRFDFMKGLDNTVAMDPWAVQIAVSVFCLTPGVADQFLLEGKKGDDHWDPSNTKGEVIENFLESGEVREDDYEKASIYAMLYGMYHSVGTVKHTDGSEYEFNFNTWGIMNVDDKPYGPGEPQRHGKAAYNKLISSFEAVQEFMASKPDNSVTVLEVGCGTGAGGNLISSEVFPDKIKTYNALDMQAGGIRKCQNFVSRGNKKLNCVLGNGKELPFEKDSIDIIIVSETHIAEIEIGDEEKAIFKEMVRVLKKDGDAGFFLWGNALPTKVWGEGQKYLTGTHMLDSNENNNFATPYNFEMCGNFNHTESAVIARDQDHERVQLYLKQMWSTFPVFKVPYFGPKCESVGNMLVRNFFRDVGTDLYKRMVTCDDSYMHQCYKLKVGVRADQK